MPIVDELKSINRLEAAGFSDQQAKAIVEVVEQGIQRGFERFAEVLDRRMGEFDHRLDEMEQRLKLEIQGVRMEIQVVRTEMQTMRAELLKEQRDQIIRFVGLVAVLMTILGGVLKFL
jgi:hypothetical protein